ncbi:hypothetical protein A2U13_04865 [Fusobacterium necrophorum subsp. funduliforme]|uniref:Uncharacterized protein n=2 Tax=Fusobacterium necrophorum TaxID=859 RepID=A0A4Q2KZ94_9FUSO|nr:YegP family protein [Fusobacterium necrophorum]KYM64581.1 hypothetical protein A2U13_04865 [Fusobacterium necrophorum subsp. funduliforme]KDE67337.1 hypothetical protein FUSO5_00280 [Fusobacterium necrophorum BFTR-1]KDE68196.1 hypothetical protein FUSO4_00965 [Fusobacterium necrophorum DJ-1]KDE72506.1 hypothetical protein FUSO8_05045 [Fusobacterium necrophorum DJ-2]MBR8733565.1 hypothetical protein [Fusobacterium necrophorum]
MSEYYWRIKVIDGEIIYKGEKYTQILLKEFFYTKQDALRALERVKKMYSNKKIFFEHNIRGKWVLYEI